MGDELNREQLEIERNEALYRQSLEASLNGYREDFERGEKIALLECVIFCATNQLHLPRWALLQLARAALDYAFRGSKDFHSAIFGAEKGSGRHAHVATRRRKELEHQLWFDIVWALRQQGLKGDELYAQAIIEISRGHAIFPDGALHLEAIASPKVPDPETLRKTVRRMLTTGVRPKFAFMFMPCGPLPTKPASN